MELYNCWFGASACELLHFMSEFVDLDIVCGKETFLIVGSSYRLNVLINGKLIMFV